MKVEYSAKLTYFKNLEIKFLGFVLCCSSGDSCVFLEIFSFPLFFYLPSKSSLENMLHYDIRYLKNSCCNTILDYTQY